MAPFTPTPWYLMKNPASTAPKMAAAPYHKRMGREEREAHILEEAVNFFAEHGFEGKTRELAKRIGITQPLLYRYFPSKESLIERVYQEVYVRRWNPAWETILTDRGRPLEERLTAFYQAYADAIYDYVWVRIFIYSGLKGVDINNRYLAIIRDKVLLPICRELRREFAPSTAQDLPVGEAEIELAWSLHGMFFYRAVRHFVYGLPMTADPKSAIANDVRVFLKGAAPIVGAVNDPSTS